MKLSGLFYHQVPEGTVVSKDAKLAFCRAARVFIQYLTAWYDTS